MGVSMILKILDNKPKLGINEQIKRKRKFNGVLLNKKLEKVSFMILRECTKTFLTKY